MAEPVTIQDIYSLFQRSQAEADRRAAEADRRAAEADRRFAESKAEADRRAAEADRLFAESKAEADRRFAESKAEADRLFAESKAEADRRSDALDRRLAELAEAADRRTAQAEARLARAETIAAQANQAVSSLSSRWGTFVENLVAPAVIRLFQEQGIAVQEVHQRVRAQRGGLNLEVDILAVDDTVAVAVEVKSRLTQKNTQKFIQNLARFKEAFPAYRAYQIYGAVAAIELDRGADRYAYNQGLFVIRQAGDSVTLDYNPDFRPQVW